MAKDSIYVFDKLTNVGIKYGEIQSFFNMCLTIDGTKDSWKIEVLSFIGDEVEPYSIVYHKKTNTWWIATQDKVERYQNDSGFFYVHNLQLEGARELLNARDLTDCGFNDNTYTVSEFITRLFALSTFEHTFEFDSNISYSFLNKKVDFIKTYENYTLLSALIDICDAYNSCPKLSFSGSYSMSNDTYTLNNAILHIHPKTGDFTLPTHNISEFDEVKEVKVLSKESYGTCVVSNAENVISSKTKTYPSNGTVKLSSNENIIKPESALIRLPSKVYKGNWIKMCFPTMISIEDTTSNFYNTFDYLPYSSYSYISLADFVYNTIYAETQNSNYAQAVKQKLLELQESLSYTLNSVGSITMYNGNKIVPTFSSNSATVDIQKGDDVPYLAKMWNKQYDDYVPLTKYIFCDKETMEVLKYKEQGIVWERGSNIISGFDFLNYIDAPLGIDSIELSGTDYQKDTGNVFSFSYEDTSVSPSITRTIELNVNAKRFVNLKDAMNTYFIVNYIPMTDLKIKLDNDMDKQDIKLYNQNGKITDNVAFSKMLNSYSKEISSNKITRYMNYYNFFDIPKVGSVVINNNEYYVINNISYDITQNESSTDFGYFIECEFTMCKFVSTKSLMVNPNTNIRDYGIPQNFNVKRKQLYRDYYELNYSNVSGANGVSPLLNWTKVFNYTNETSDDIDLTAIIQLRYESAINGQNHWYYQLNTVTYYLDKMFMIVLDFQDNNIIGYDSQNVWSGFAISRIFSGLTDNVNTPVSYVDDNGRFEHADICLCTNSQITFIYNAYQNDQTGGSSYSGSLYNNCVFIPAGIYGLAIYNNSIRISADNYNKDALEVPVFEYTCQIGDSEEVLIGDNILQQRQECQYFYSFVIGSENQVMTQNNTATYNTIEELTSPNRLFLDNAVVFETISSGQTKRLLIKFYLSETFNMSSQEYSYGSTIYPTANRDIAIFRHSYNKRTGEQTVDLLFILKKVPSSAISTNTIELRANYWKLK